MRLAYILPLLLLALSACETDGARTASQKSGASRQLDTTTPTETRYLRLAKRAEAQGKIELAAVLYRAASLANEKDPAPRIGAAELFEKAGEYDAAAQILDQLAKENDGDKDLQLQAARNFLKAGKYSEARKRYEEIIVKDPADWRGYNGLAVTHDLNRNQAAAQSNYELAEAKAPADMKANVVANWALSLMMSGNATLAVSKLEALPDNDSPKLKKRLALAYALAGRTDEAKALGLTKIPTNKDLQRELRAGDRPPPQPEAPPPLPGAVDTNQMDLPPIGADSIAPPPKP